MLKLRLLLIPLTLLMLGLLLWNKSQAVKEVHIMGPTMGTFYNVKIRDGIGPSKDDTQRQIDALLIKINALMSTYDDSSELSRFNQFDQVSEVQLSPETALVIQEAIRLGAISEGVLDVTVGPLVNLWGFGPQSRPEKIPSASQIAEIREYVGLDKLELNGSRIRKHHPNLYVDLSTIAKGYAVDQVADLLESHGHHNYLVEIGGEMRVKGQNKSDIDWILAVEKPIVNERDVQAFLMIGDNAIASSGDYRNFYMEDGVRYSHLIDPRTGKPIQHNLVSVTVVHPSSMTADGLATALIVMGKEQALKVARQYNLDVMLITRENDGFEAYTSGKFDEYMNAVR